MVRPSVGRGGVELELDFWGGGRGEYMEVEVLGRSIIAGSDREHGK